ncbi:MAG: molybdopterin molybdotransferase MoeA, partial [Gammaproteobacteria bacterium]
MTDVADAERLIAARMPVIGTTILALDDANGAVLRQAVRAERDQPPFDRVTMDGIAINFSDWESGIREFELAGTQAAGEAALEVGSSGRCVEIMTGAMRPTGANCIIPVERTTRSDGAIRVGDDASVEKHQFIHPRGSDRQAGIELLAPGMRLGPPEVAILASAGCSEITASSLPSVAVISTGDELVDVDEPIADYQIRSSNDRAIEASLKRHRVATVTRSRLRDERSGMLDAIHELHEQNDVLILSGGVSMGQYDFVPSVLEELGVELVFHRIRQRPGRPMWFGMSRNGKVVFALPGNPVSTMVCLQRYVLPAMKQMLGLESGATEIVQLSDDVEFTADLAYFLPVVVTWTDNGTGIAEPRPTNTSGDFVSLAGTDGFVELPRGTD